MKKVIAVLTASLLAVFALTGCSKSNSKNFAATYFSKNAETTGTATVSETLTYDVSSYTKLSDTYLKGLFPEISVLNEDLSFEVDSSNSNYTTTIYNTEDGKNYVFKSRLIIAGKYVYGSKKTEYAVERDVTDITVTFKGIGSKFQPVSVTKTAKNVVPLSTAPSSEKDFVTLDYTYTVAYGSSAKITVKANDDTTAKYFTAQTRKPTEIKKWNKKDFVENDILYTVFRNFDYSPDFSYAYNTIDAVSGALTSASASMIGSAAASTIVKLPSNVYLYSGSYSAFNAYGVKFATTGKYGKAYAYSYFAKSINNGGEAADKDDKNVTRRVPLIIAQPSIHNTGYLVFTLHNANNYPSQGLTD